MGRFGGLRDAQANKVSSYLDPGRYKAKITKLDWNDEMPKGGSALFVEFELLESSNPKEHPVGKRYSWCQKKNRSFLPAVKGFLFAAVGYDTNNPDHAKIVQEHVEPVCEAFMDLALEKNILAGRVIDIEVVTKPLKESTGDFNLHKFSPAQAPPPVENWAKFKKAS